MRTWDEAFDIASKSFAHLGSETVLLSSAFGRTLAVDAVSLCDLPAFETSAMDGWAVCGPSPWKVIGEVATGKASEQTIGNQECMKISTGGVVPKGATSVIPWEIAHEDAGSITGVIDLGANIRPAGVESNKNDILFVAGTRLNSPMVGLLAATGHDKLVVRRKPRIAIFFLGDELLHTGVPTDGAIRDALGPQLPAMIEGFGADVVFARFVKDDLDTLNSQIAESLHDADMIITTGGTADGPKDYVKFAISQLRGRYLLDCVKVRPGYHILLATIEHDDRHIAFLALPGNPQSAIAALTSFGRPVINSLLGAPTMPPSAIQLAQEFKTQEGFSRLVPGNLEGSTFTPTGYLGSAMLRGVAQASGFALVDPGGKSARWLELPTF